MRIFRCAAPALALLACLALAGCETSPDRNLRPMRPDRLLGISYHPWFPPVSWTDTWDRPLLGSYHAADEFAIRQHALWLFGAGADFIVIDWSNNTGASDTPEIQQIEEATRAVFKVFANFDDPIEICLMLGIGGDPANLSNGALQAKADQVYNEFAAEKAYARILQYYNEKPLLLVYVGNPTPWPDGPPPWDDPRFTVRFVTAFAEDQPGLIDEQGYVRHGYWSWWERTPQRYPLMGGRPECIAVSAAYPGAGGWDDADARGRNGGDTFIAQWGVVRNADPTFVLVNSWNEWYPAEEKSFEHSNDIEPARSYQYEYLQLLESGGKAWRAMPRPAFPAKPNAPAPADEAPPSEQDAPPAPPAESAQSDPADPASPPR